VTESFFQGVIFLILHDPSTTDYSFLDSLQANDSFHRKALMPRVLQGRDCSSTEKHAHAFKDDAAQEEEQKECNPDRRDRGLVLLRGCFGVGRFATFGSFALGKLLVLETLRGCLDHDGGRMDAGGGHAGGNRLAHETRKKH